MGYSKTIEWGHPNLRRREKNANEMGKAEKRRQEESSAVLKISTELEIRFKYTAIRKRCGVWAKSSHWKVHPKKV